MVWIKWIVIAIISFKILAYFGYLFSLWNTGTYSTPMKWKMIKQLYLINPDRWKYTYYEDHSRYCMDSESAYRHLMYQGYMIRVSFFAYQILRFNYKKMHRENKKRAQNQRKRKILELAQKDINIKMQEAQKEIETAIKEMKGVVK